MKLERTEAWMKDRPQIQAQFSAYLVGFAEALYQMYLGLEYNREFAHIFSIQDKTVWLNLYKDFIVEFRKNEGQLFNLLKAQYSQHQTSLTKIENLRKSKKPVLDDLSNFMYEFTGDQYPSNFSEQEIGKEKLLKFWESVLKFPYAVFTIKVFFPCILLYQCTPQVLLRNTIKGDFGSLEKLLILDKNIITTIPEIEKIWEQENRNTNSVRFKRLQKALGMSPYKKITAIRIKTAIAAGIEFVFKLSGKEITRPEIRKLFDAYAQDSNKGPIDTDLQDTNDGFNRALNRETKKFIRIYQTMVNN
jgi:hypothetical protein